MPITIITAAATLLSEEHLKTLFYKEPCGQLPQAAVHPNIQKGRDIRLGVPRGIFKAILIFQMPEGGP